MSQSGAKAGLETDGPDLERRGRIVGIALFWLLLCYVIGMSSSSILPAVFWPHLAPLASDPAAARCGRELDALERQLLAKAGQALRQAEPGKVRHWLGAWDKRVVSLAGGCGPLEGTRADLLELRSEIGSLLDAYESGPLKVHQRIRRALDSVHASTPPHSGPE